MRFLLTSAGITNASIRDALVDLLGTPISECNALCIPTLTHALGQPELAWKFISGQEPRTAMCELGWKSFGLLELTALPSIDEEQWVPKVQETNIMAAPTPENLQRLGGTLADRTLRVPLQATYELAQAPDALDALATRHVQGKLAIRIQ